MEFEKLKEGLINKKTSAYKYLYKKFYKDLLNYSFVIVKDFIIAEKIVDDVFVQLIEDITKIQGDNELILRRWLLILTRRKSWKYIRCNGTAIVEELNEDFENLPNISVINNFNDIIVLFNGLYLELLTLKYVVHLKSHEIYNILNITEDFLKKAKSKIKKELGEQLYE